MNSKILHLLFTIINFLILLQCPNGSSNLNDYYSTCGKTFTCGNTITGIGYPFRGIFEPAYCGNPHLVLLCDGAEHDDATYINITNTTYVVLEINQTAQTMRIVSLDILVETCPQRMANTTLDRSIFEYTSASSNLTYLYGCPMDGSHPGSSVADCGDGVYVVRGNQAPGNCNGSVIVPVLGNYENEFLGLEYLRQGFEIRWNVDGKACSDCVESNGRCGYNYATNRTACFCLDPPNVADICSMATAASPANTLSPGNRSSSNRTRMQIGLWIGGAVLAGIGLGCLIFYIRRMSKQRLASESAQIVSKEISRSHSSKGLLISPSATFFTRSIPSYPSSNLDFARDSCYFGVQVFDYTELEEATDNFNASRELGDGGFGTVYYGELSDGRVVAVKRLYENNFKRVEQFMNEVEILTRLTHKNLVKLFGCTSKRSRELLLVYEYISNGTVADHLHGNRAKSAGLLSWPVRMNIAVETAEALAFLHKSDIIHRDVKTNNILLTDDFHVKVADFGLSRLFPNNVTHVSTAPQGTPGYVDPEYYQCYHLTEKSDVFSFGVVLIELISSLQAVDTSRHRHDINLSNMAITKIQNRMLNELVDPRVGFETNSGVRRMITLVAELAFRCLQQERDVRPSMDEVLEGLRRIQDEDLNAHKVDIVDILAEDKDTEPLNGIVAPPSSNSVATENWISGSAPNSNG